MSTALTIQQRAVAAIGITAEQEQQLVALAAQSTHITAITNKAGYDQAHSARMALKNQRLKIKEDAEVARDEANKFAKAVIAEQNRIIALIQPEETRLQGLQDDWDAAREAEKQAAIEAEQKRVADLQERVSILRGNRTLTAMSDSALIAQHIEDVETIAVDDTFAEFLEQAEDAKVAGLAWLRQVHAAALAHEAEQARIKTERAELARLRKAEEERQATERARLAEEERVARAAREAEADRQAEELRKQRADQEAENARVRAEQEAAARVERERIAEEQRRLATERAEFQRQQDEIRKAKEAEEATRAEQARIAALRRPDDAELVRVLANHFRAPEALVLSWLAATNWKKAKAA